VPAYEWTTTISQCIQQVFDFLSQPENLIRVSPPEFHMRLVEAPERLHTGARVVLQGRRWGVSQRIVSEITACRPSTLIVDEQREGPFKKWIHTHQLEPILEGTRMLDRIEFQSPGGVLGLLLTTARIEQELKEIFEFRARKFKEFLESQSPDK
jgi:ligand-binding SRPBCC domain-containing protein